MPPPPATDDSYHIDETYLKVKGRWTNLYRAVDSVGQTIDFLLSAKRDAVAAKRFLRRALKVPPHSSPRVITVDKNPAYPPAIDALKAAGRLAKGCELRQGKCLNNLVEQDHRFIKRRVRPGLGFFSFKTARRTIRGYEVMHQIRKGQINGVGEGDIQGQVRFIASVFAAAA